MKVGTKSVIGGAHCFLLHPFFVAWGWKRLFGFPCDLRLWFAFALHDIGYVGLRRHGRSGGRAACPAWSAHHGFALRTGVGGRVPCGIRDIGAAGWGLPISRLMPGGQVGVSRSLPHGCICRWRDGRASCRSTWCARGSGRLATTGSRSRKNGWSALRFPKIGCAGLQSYTLRWVERHRDLSGRPSEA